MRRRNAVLPSLLLALSVVVLAASSGGRAVCHMGPTGARSCGSLRVRLVPHVRSCCDDRRRLRPRAARLPRLPFRVRALSPDGAASNVSMSPDSVDDRVWRGSLTPDVQGRWTLIITNMQGSDTACYTHAVLVVHGEAGDRTPTYVTVGVVMVLGGIAGFTLFRRRASATRRVSRTD